MNLPNIITLSRIPLMFVIVGLMYYEWTGAASLAFALFVIAAGGDWLDGYLARTRGLVTTFGTLMDALTDKIMVMGLVIAFVGGPDRGIPMPLALITLCREFLVTGMRMVAATKGVIVPADGGGKSKTITQLIALGFLLAAPMVARDVAQAMHRDLTHAGDIIRLTGTYIFLFGTLLAVWSGCRYIAQFRHVVFGDSEQ